MPSAQILVVGGDHEANAAIRAALADEFQLLFAGSGEEGLKLAGRPSLVIVDQKHPNLDVLKELRSTRRGASLSVILLSPFNETVDKVLALEMGADDYLLKPFDPKELLAHVRAALRRAEMAGAGPKEESKVVAGGVELDVGAQKLSVGEASYTLTVTETALLKVLMENKGQVLSRDRILNYVWGEEFAVNPRVVDVYISTLRKKCFSRIPEKTYIRGIRGAGYRFEDLGAPGDNKPFLPVSGSVKIQNIPRSALPFVGRGVELTKLIGFLKDEPSRLLTLLGPGGMGKTRLACEAASGAGEFFRNGVCFVNLAPLASHAYIVPTIADALDISLYGQQDAKTQLLTYLREKEMALVMDNFEHLLEGASLVSEILASAPGIKILCTSRERLNLRDETVLEIDGMDDGNEAIQLFLQGARRNDPGFALSEADELHVKLICRMVGGMPLGIELASAWVKLLPCKEIAREIDKSRDFLATSLRDVPERHKSLRAAFEWSWNRIPEEERKTFRRLSVFRGGFTREAAEKICDASLPQLLLLADKSLIRKSKTGRYVIHEVLREYAGEKLREQAGEEKQILDEYGRYYLELARRLDCDMKGGPQLQAMEEMGEEIENLRQALDRSLSLFDANGITHIAEALYLFHDLTGRYREGEELFSHAVNRVERRCVMDKAGQSERKIFGELLLNLGIFRMRLAQYESAGELFGRSLSIFKQSNLVEDEALSLQCMGMLECRRGNRVAAKSLLDKVLIMTEKSGDRHAAAVRLNSLGICATLDGRYDEAEALFQKSLSIRNELNDRYGAGAELSNLGSLSFFKKNYADARRLFQESCAIAEELRDIHGHTDAISNLGLIHLKLGEYAEAEKCFLRSLEIYRDIGAESHKASTLQNLAEVFCGSGDLQQSKQYVREGLMIAAGIPSVPLILSLIVTSAKLYAKEGKEEEAIELLSLVIEHPQTEDENRGDAEELLSLLRTRFTDDKLTVILKRGKERELNEICGLLQEEVKNPA